MENFSEMPSLKQWVVLLAVGALVTVGLYFTVFKSKREANAQAEQTLNAKLRENAELESYRPKLKDMERQVANLKQQMEIESHIVPNEKEADNFIRMLDAEAAKTGIEIRRYTAKPVTTQEYYAEAPFEVELDGPYYSVLSFFDHVSKLERIVNISGLLVATTKKPSEAHTKHSYDYAPSESIVATCVASTFFTRDPNPPATAAAKPARGAL
ncbi:MAG TPA: type 4a pilus biogenesis protein PilO [Terriglobales bacterium]|nr:type 4a pilus biogenesis protein PilO [Terriglobales bacterium]